MSNTPKIMVFKLKELIYTGIFILLGLLLIIFLIKMFKSDKKESPTGTTQHSEVASESITESPQNQTTEIENSENITSQSEVLQSETYSDSTSANEVSSNETSFNETSENTTSQTENTSTAPAKKTPGNKYSPGIYTSSLVLNNSALEVEVCVDLDSINSISIKNMDEAITTMYPLMSNSIEDLEKQIVNSQSLDNITYAAENRYTYMVLLDAINHALSKAESEG